jgi:hypothetical protein
MIHSTSTTLYCANHPTVETSLRCNRCEKPICAKCAVKMPTGYRCKECVKSQMKIFDTAEWVDYATGFLAAGFLSLVASFLMSLLGYIGFFGWFIIIAGAPTAGVVIAEGVRWATRRHRSQSLFITVCAAVVFGALPLIIAQVIIFNPFGLIFQVIYLVLAVPTVYSRLSGLQLFR